MDRNQSPTLDDIESGLVGPAATRQFQVTRIETPPSRDEIPSITVPDEQPLIPGERPVADDDKIDDEDDFERNRLRTPTQSPRRRRYAQASPRPSPFTQLFSFRNTTRMGKFKRAAFLFGTGFIILPLSGYGLYKFILFLAGREKF